MHRLLWSLLFLVACTSRPEQAPPRPGPSEPDAGPPPMLRVLFIGNSYTYANSLPEMLKAFTRSRLPATSLETEAVLFGGATLRLHQTVGTAPQRIQAGGWDYVVLQEQSQLGGLHINGAPFLGKPEDLFFPAARQLSAQATAAGARPLFYMTWSRKADLADQSHLTWAYGRIANELGAPLAPVGVAWERVRREHPEIELYQSDGNHPGPAGSYLAACVMFASIFRQPCTGAPNTLTGGPWTSSGFDSAHPVTLVTLPEDTARYLQEVGSEVALADRLPDASAQPHPPLPELPSGEPLQQSRLTGQWSGSLALYPSEVGMSPATMLLTLDGRATPLTGQVRLTFPQGGSAEAAITPQLQNDELSFSIQDGAYLESTVQFRAVLKNGALQGVASAQDPPGGRWYGSWTVSPAR